MFTCCLGLATTQGLQEKETPLKSQDLRGVWQREKDSNPHIQSQSLLCYPYTIPLYPSAAVLAATFAIIAGKMRLSRENFGPDQFSFSLFSRPVTDPGRNKGRDGWSGGNACLLQQVSLL